MAECRSVDTEQWDNALDAASGKQNSALDGNSGEQNRARALDAADLDDMQSSAIEVDEPEEQSNKLVVTESDEPQNSALEVSEPEEQNNELDAEPNEMLNWINVAACEQSIPMDVAELGERNNALGLAESSEPQNSALEVGEPGEQNSALGVAKSDESQKRVLDVAKPGEQNSALGVAKSDESQKRVLDVAKPGEQNSALGVAKSGEPQNIALDVTKPGEQQHLKIHLEVNASALRIGHLLRRTMTAECTKKEECTDIKKCTKRKGLAKKKERKKKKCTIKTETFTEEAEEELEMGRCEIEKPKTVVPVICCKVYYKCRICDTFLETQTRGVRHVQNKHGESYKMKTEPGSSVYRTLRRSAGNPFGKRVFDVMDEAELLHTEEFKDSKVLLERYIPPPQKPIRRSSQRSQALKSNTKAAIPLQTNTKAEVSFRTNPKAEIGPSKGSHKRKTEPPNRMEIKLETLKAGEIETLISNLFKPTQAVMIRDQNSLDEMIVEVRKSNRKIKKRVTRNYGELNSDDEEILRNGVVTDPDYPTAELEPEDDDQEYSTHGSKKRKKSTTSKSQSTLTENGKRMVSRIVRIKNENGEMVEKQIIVPRKKEQSRYSGKVVKSRFRCRICQLDFPLPKEYIEHMYSEHRDSNGNYKCPYCTDKVVNNMQNFTSHMKRHETRKMNIKGNNDCAKCGRTFQYHSLLKEHEKVHTTAPKPCQLIPRPFACPICHCRFPQKYRLQRHFILHLDNNPYSCKFEGCTKRFNSQSNLRRHSELHYDPKTFSCQQCPAYYNRETRLKAHVEKFHNKDKPHLGRAYNKRPNRKPQTQTVNDVPEEKSRATESVHINDTNRTEQNAAGNFVPAVIKWDAEPVQRLSMNAIMMADPVVQKLLLENPEAAAVLPSAYYNNPDANFKCDLCSWTTCRSFLLQQHMVKFHGKTASALLLSKNAVSEDPEAISVICGSCGYNSPSPDDLAEHIKKAHDFLDTPFYCSRCGLRFKTEIRMKRHVREIHLSEKKYKCDKCPIAYATPANLRKHKREKHDPDYLKKAVEEFRCERCCRVLVNRKSYLIHMELHDEGQKHRRTCQICNQTCSNIHSLKRHIQYVHMGTKNPYNEKRKNKRLQLAQLSRSAHNADAGRATKSDLDKGQPTNIDTPEDKSSAGDKPSLSNSSPETESTEIMGL